MGSAGATLAGVTWSTFYRVASTSSGESCLYMQRVEFHKGSDLKRK